MTDPKIAFFDLDKTILECNSANLWVKRELKLGHLSYFQFIESMYWLMLYHAGKADVRTFLNKASGWVTGAPEAEIIQRTTDFWNEEVRSQIRPKAVEAIERHRKQGDLIVLLTSSSNYLSPLAADVLNIPHILCNRLIAKDGIMTGEMANPLCFGDGKSIHAKQFAEKMNMSWKDSYFYTDSYSDHPFMLEIDHPIAVTPDKRLRKMAKQKGWDILEW